MEEKELLICYLVENVLCSDEILRYLLPDKHGDFASFNQNVDKYIEELSLRSDDIRYRWIETETEKLLATILHHKDGISFTLSGAFEYDMLQAIYDLFALYIALYCKGILPCSQCVEDITAMFGYECSDVSSANSHNHEDQED